MSEQLGVLVYNYRIRVGVIADGDDMRVGLSLRPDAVEQDLVFVLMSEEAKRLGAQLQQTAELAEGKEITIVADGDGALEGI